MLPRRFLGWLVLVYAGWAVAWRTAGVSLAGEWPIALAMALGSFVAGATPMGGGSVGFPVLVLVFDLPTALGRDFSFAIQSVGMTSASVLILARGQPLHRRMLGPAMVGAALGTPLGLVLLADRLSDVAVTLVFAVLLAAFGLLHLRHARELVAIEGAREHAGVLEPLVGFLAGGLGGAVVASTTGVGTDVLLYMALVLVSRTDLRIAIPTSVVLMAWTSLVGLAAQAALGRLHGGLLAPWLAAAPVVAVGAPLGAYVISWLERTAVLRFVAALCLAQLAWACTDGFEALGVEGVVAALVAVGFVWAAFEALRAWGLGLAALEVSPRGPGPGRPPVGRSRPASRGAGPPARPVPGRGG